jgi:replicative DNA helicase
MGKSTLADQIAVHVSRVHGPVVLASNEMIPDDVFAREVSREGQVPLGVVEELAVDDDRQVTAMAHAARRLAELPYQIVDAAGMSVLDLRSITRRLQQQGDLRLLIVDYLQKVRPHTHGMGREQQVSAISGALSDLAKELQIPVILVAQLNRDKDREKDKRPTLSDLRESGAIENDAWAVVLIHRDGYWERHREGYQAERPGPGKEEPAELIIAKNRNGRCGSLSVQFRGALCRFEEADTRHSEHAFGPWGEARAEHVPADPAPPPPAEKDDEDLLFG